MYPSRSDAAADRPAGRTAGYDRGVPDARARRGATDEQRRPDDHVPRARGPALPAARRVRGAGGRHRGALRAGGRRPRGLLARAGEGAADLGARSPRRACDRSNPPFFTWFADGTLNASVQVPRPPPRVEAATRVAFLWEGEPGRADGGHLPRPPRARLPAVERPARARRRQGRPGGDLPRDDPGDRRRDARLRPHRRAAHGDLRRLLPRLGARPRAGLRRHRDDHRRRRVARRQAGAAEGERGRRARGRPGRAHLRRGAPHRERDRLGRGAGRLVPRARRGPVRRGRAGDRGRRAPALHPLHVRARPGSRRASSTPPAAT